MNVKQLLEQKPSRLITASPDTGLVNAMELLIKNRISCLPVIDKDQLVGILSDKDIFRAVYDKRSDFESLSVGSAMTSELIVGVADDTVDYIANVMTENRIRHVPIVDGPRLVGLISIGDVVKHQMSSIEVENRYLRTYIEGGYPA